MLTWLAQNLGTVLITLALALMVTAIVVHLVRRKGPPCSCGCEGCGCGCERKPHP